MIELRNVSVKYGKHSILHDINVNIAKGEFVSLIGLNGSGKTTLLKAIIGSVKISSGEIKVKTKRIGYVPQKLNFDRSIPITVSEFIKLFNSNNSKIVNKALAEVGLKEIGDQRIGNLSGGQLQRVLIANALLKKPKLLILDEATAGIDVKGEQQFYELIRRIHKQYKMTVILVSHDIHTVFANTDRVICLDGCICCQGEPASVAANPKFKTLFAAHLKPYQHNHHKHVGHNC